MERKAKISEILEWEHILKGIILLAVLLVFTLHPLAHQVGKYRTSYSFMGSAFLW